MIADSTDNIQDTKVRQFWNNAYYISKERFLETSF
jgi:hypothetical protein